MEPSPPLYSRRKLALAKKKSQAVVLPPEGTGPIARRRAQAQHTKKLWKSGKVGHSQPPTDRATATRIQNAAKARAALAAKRAAVATGSSTPAKPPRSAAYRRKLSAAMKESHRRRMQTNESAKSAVATA